MFIAPYISKDFNATLLLASKYIHNNVAWAFIVALVAVCQDCGSIAPVPASVVDALGTGTQVTTGFVLEPGHFALEGICAACAA